MPDKTQWPKSDHGFFMHPPLLKATTGSPKTQRYKGCSEKKRKNGKQNTCALFARKMGIVGTIVRKPERQPRGHCCDDGCEVI
jgi:hypothetical protein